jgi:8-oxo-dGTP diphosphatase
MPRRASVLILYNEKKEILLQHRSKDARNAPNLWAFFGGGIEEGETPLQALEREIWEELEYKTKSPHFLGHFDYEGKSNVYTYVEKYDESQTLHQHEGQGLGWFTIADTVNLEMKENNRLTIKVVGSFLAKI